MSKRGSCVKESRHRARLSDYGPDGILREEADFGAEIEEEEVAWGELNGGGISSELVGLRMTISTRRLRARPSAEVFSATGWNSA